MSDLSWVDGLILTVGVVIGAYLKKFGSWLKSVLTKAQSPEA